MKSANLLTAGLDRDLGWLFRAVERSCGYLPAEFGFDVADVVIHHESSYVTYRRDHMEILVEYTPSSEDIRLEVVVQPSDDPLEAPQSIEAWDLLAAREPDTDWWAWPRNRGDPRKVEKLIELWAAGLRRLAPDVLAGKLPTSVPWFHWWGPSPSDRP